MTEKKFENRSTKMSKIIQLEKQSALEDFRKKDFRAVLEEKINAKAKQKHTVPWPIRKPVPVIVSLILIFIFGVVIKNIVVPSPYEKSQMAFEKILTQTTHIFKTDEIQAPALSTEDKTLSDVEWATKRSLLNLHRKSIPDEEIPFLFFEVLNKVAGDRDYRRVIYEEKESESTRLEQEINKLRNEQNYHQLFLQVLKKLLEV